MREAEDADRLFYHLVALFEDKILLAHRSKFVQFVIFYTCSKVEKFAVLFTRKLMNIFLDEHNSLWKRQCSIMYLASYCARAGFLPLGVIRDVLFQLIDWVDRYAGTHGAAQIHSSYETDK